MPTYGPIEFVERSPQVDGLGGILDHYSKQFLDDILRLLATDRRRVGGGDTHLFKSKSTCKHAIYQIFANNRCEN